MRFSVFEKDISHIRDSITHGEFKKALELINEFEKKEFSITTPQANAFYKLYSNKFYLLCTTSSVKSGIK